MKKADKIGAALALSSLCFSCVPEETPLLSAGKARGTFNFRPDRHPAFSFEGAASRILVNGKWISSKGYPRQKVSSSGDGLTTVFLWSGLDGAPDLETKFYHCGCSSIEITSRAAAGGSSFDVGGFEPVSCLPEEGCKFLHKAAANEEASFLLNGYQSWSYSGVVKPGRLDGEVEEIPFWGNNGDMLNINSFFSWWYGAIHLRAKSETLMIGGLTAALWKPSLVFFETEEGYVLRLLNGATGDARNIRPGEEVSSEVNYLKYGTGNFPAEAWAEKAAEKTPPLARNGNPPKGWNSWYQLWSGVKAEDVLANAAVLKREFSPLGYDLVQIDDGWEKAWGDWRPNDKFPDGMDGIAGKLSEMGLKAGVWLAPFLVDEAAPIKSEHPDWFVRSKEDGSPLYYQNPGQPEKRYLLDVTNPEAAAWLRQVFEGLRDAGYTFFKIDFLFAGAYEGRRHEEVTAMEAYHRGLEIIREAAGEDAFILACGAPILPTVGHAHANRVGPDIAFSSPGPAFSFIAHQARNDFTRYFLGELHFTDPDEIVVREPLTGDEAAAAAALGLSAGGGMAAIGDDLTALPAERLDLLKRVLAAADKLSYPVPFDLFERVDEKPVLSPLLDYIKAHKETSSAGPSAVFAGIEDGLLVAVFNWTAEEREERVDLGLLGVAASSFIGVDILTGSEIKLSGTTYSVKIKPHAVWLAKFSRK